MMLIDCKGDVNASDNDGNRPVHLAALNGHEEVCLFGVNLQKKPVVAAYFCKNELFK